MGNPDAPVRESSPILCGHCLRRMFYAPNTARYICLVHGPGLTVEQLYRWMRVQL